MRMIKLFLSSSLVFVLGLSGSVFAEGNAKQGQEVYDLWCAICHEGGSHEGYGGSQQLAKTRGESLAIIKSNDALAPEYIEAVVRKGLGMMPPFRKTELTDDQLEDMIAYLLSDL